MTSLTPLDNEDRAYRRGVVLGFTLAEIMILILFVLLLALAYAFRKQVLVIRELQKKVDTYSQAIGIHPELIDVAKSIERRRQMDAPDRDPNEYFTQLLMDIAKSEDTRKALDEEQARNTSLTNQLADAKAEVTKAKSDVEKLTSAFGDKSPSEIVKHLSETQLALNDAKGKVSKLEQQLGLSGNGRVLPPCWSDANQKIEFTFDVKLTSTNIEVRLKSLPQRHDQIVELLGSDNTEPMGVSGAGFLSMTQKMFDWSVHENCRFYVTVYDATAASEKAIYKDELRDVEGHFYKKLVDSPQW